MEMPVCVGLDKRVSECVADSQHLSEDNVRRDNDPVAGLVAHPILDDLLNSFFPIRNVFVVLDPLSCSFFLAGQEKSRLVQEGYLQSAKYEARGGEGRGRGAFCVSLNSTCFALTRSAHLPRYGPSS